MAAPISSIAQAEQEPEAGPKTLTGAQILWASLVREGVKVVFGYPGGELSPRIEFQLLENSAQVGGDRAF